MVKSSKFDAAEPAKVDEIPSSVENLSSFAVEKAEAVDMSQVEAPHPAPEPARKATGPAKPVSLWFAVKKTSPQAFLAAQRAERWDAFSGATEEGYDAAIGRLMDPAAKSVEAHFARSTTRPGFFAAAAAYHGWPIGLELSPEDYESQIKEALDVRIG